MTRVQILLDKKEVKVLHTLTHRTGKSCSQLVREAIDGAYLSRYSSEEIAEMARDAKNAKGTKKFSNSGDFLNYLWRI